MSLNHKVGSLPTDWNQDPYYLVSHFLQKVSFLLVADIFLHILCMINPIPSQIDCVCLLVTPSIPRTYLGPTSLADF